MSKRNTIINTELRTPIHRPARLLHDQKNTPETEKLMTRKSEPTNNCLQSSNFLLKPRKDRPKTRTSLELCRSDSGLRRSPRLNYGVDVSQSLRQSTKLELCRCNNGLTISPRLNNGVDISEIHRRFTRPSDKQNAEELLKKKTCEDQVKKFINCRSNKRKGKCEVDVGSCEQKEVIGFGVVLGLKAIKEDQGEKKAGNVVQGSEEINGKRKRKCEVQVKKSINCRSNKKTGKCEVAVGSCEQKEVIGFGVVLGLKAIKENQGEAKAGNVVQGSDEINGKRKRKYKKEGKENSKTHGWTKEQEVALQRAYFATKPTLHFRKDVSKLVPGKSAKDWTKEQEVALQRAYFAAKPTPHFWKNVSKLVPGKSAQDCFDKVHSDHVTPPQTQPQSRANRVNSSPLKHFSISASKLLKPIEMKIKRSSCNKRKSHLAQKMVRQLLQKNCHMDPGYEADLFSVLEPNVNPSGQVHEQNGLVSTAKPLKGKQDFLRKCCERPSGHKMPLTELSDSCGMPVVSPPVLKQVKNRALHEKYIDQLHRREANRKATSARAERFMAGKENRGVIDSRKIDVVGAAKNALVRDARNIINQFQHLNENAASNSSGFDCDGMDCNDDDEGETEL